MRRTSSIGSRSAITQKAVDMADGSWEAYSVTDFEPLLEPQHAAARPRPRWHAAGDFNFSAACAKPPPPAPPHAFGVEYDVSIFAGYKRS